MKLCKCTRPKEVQGRGSVVLLTGTDAALVLPSIMRGLHALQVPASKPNLTQVLPVLASVGHNVIITEAVLGEASQPTLLDALHAINMKHQVSVTHAHVEGSMVATQAGPVAARHAGKALLRIVSGMAQAPGTMYLGSQLNQPATEYLSGSTFTAAQAQTDKAPPETTEEDPNPTEDTNYSSMSTEQLVDKVLADIEGSKKQIDKLASKSKEKLDTATAALSTAGAKQATVAQEVAKAQAKLAEIKKEYAAAKDAYEAEKKKADSKTQAAKKSEGKYNKELAMIKEIKTKVQAMETKCGLKPDEEGSLA